MRPVGFDRLMRVGRLANCLFEIAATVGYARRRRAPVALGPTDWVYRPVFSTPDEWWPDPFPPRAVDPVTLARHLPPFPRTYLQDLAIWSNAADEVRAAFAPSPAAAATVDEAWTAAGYGDLPGPVCAVHVRRGDTVTRNPADTINPLDAAYFTDAVATVDAAAVVVFTDDPAWCVDNLPADWVIHHGEPGPEDFEADFLTRPRSDWVDMFLMARIAAAGPIVLSNSVFGWWGAWIGDGATVRVPSRWFGPVLAARGCDERLIIPRHWEAVHAV